MTVLRLVVLLAVIQLCVSPTGSALCGVTKDELPPLYLPGESYFPNRAEVQNQGTVVSATDRAMVLQIRPRMYRDHEKDGTVTTYFETVPARPVTYYFHPCLWDGKLAIDATDNFSYTASDVAAGDDVRLDYVTDPRGNRWVNRISITLRQGGAVPPERRVNGVDADGSTTVERQTARLFRIHDAKLQQQAAGKK